MNKKRDVKLIIGQFIIYTTLIILSFLQFFPFYSQIVNALQPLNLVPEYGKIYLLPISYNFGNFFESVIRLELIQGIINSLIVSLGFTLLSAIVILVVGYTIGKKEFKGKTIVKSALLLTMIVPGELLLVTNYLLVSQLGWINNYAGLILPGIVNITGIFLVNSFMNTIPNALLESAEIDGANEFDKIFKIILPISLPILATYFIITFIAQWNDYLWPMIVTNDRSMFTVQLKLSEFNPYYSGFADEVLKSAGHIITIIPIIIVYLFSQKRFVENISVTGMK